MRDNKAGGFLFLRKEVDMNISQPQTRRVPVPGALISLLLGFMALGLSTISIDAIIKGPLGASLRFNTGTSGAPAVPLALLAVVMAGFLVGLVGLLLGINCLPSAAGQVRGKLCTWLAGSGIGISLITLLVDFGLISILRLFLPVP
jgi:hypothetical protein